MITDKWDTSKNVSNFNSPSITPSGFFGNSDKNIVEVENAITEEEQEILLAFAKNNNSFDDIPTEFNENGTVIYDERPWANRVITGEQLIKNSRNDIIEVVTNIINRFTVVIENFFEVKATPTGPAIVRWPVGARQEPHADKELHEGPDAGTPNSFPWYDLGTVFYLNDDYQGGELYFPIQGVEFKPKPRAGYFFPGDMNYIHGVRPISEGCRYTLPYFWTISELPEKFSGPKDFKNE